MQIDKAIEILQDLLTTEPQWPPDDRRDAVRLGIEALRRCRNFRDNSQTWGYSPLPGETKEVKSG